MAPPKAQATRTFPAAPQLQPFARYAVAVFAAVLAMLLRLALAPVWGEQLPYITFFPAIMVSAWLGGLWPGLLTTLLCSVGAAYLWLEPAGSLAVARWSDLFGLATFIVVGALISVLNEAWRRASARIAESEERLQTTLASIGDAVITTDAEGRVTGLNAVAEKLTGWTEADARGRHLDEVFVIRNELTGQPVESPLHHVLREGTVAGLANHTVLVARDGSELPIDDSAAPIRHADGPVRGVVLVFRAITERRRLERERAALLDAERAARAETERVAEELGQLQELTDVALAKVDLAALIPELLARVRAALRCDTATLLRLDDTGAYLVPVASDGLETELGADVRVPLGQGLAGRIAAREGPTVFEDVLHEEVVSPLMRERVRSLIGVPLRVGERLIGVLHAGMATPRRFSETDGHLLALAAERVALAIERARLHEEEREARRAAEAAAEQLRLALSSGRMGTWEFVPGSGAVRWSPALEAIHGYSPGAFPGTFEAFRNEIHPDDRERVLAAIGAAVEEGRAHHVEYRIVRTDGAVRWVEGRGQLFSDKAGRPARMVGVCLDVTERKRAEEVLRDADRRKTEFLAMLAHEIRNPLGAITNAAQILERLGLPEEKARWAEMIARQTAHLAHIVDDLLDVSRISRGEIVLRKRPFPVADAVRFAAETARPLVEARRLRLTTQLPAAPLWVDGDATRVAQIVGNLLSNAAKYNEDGGEIALTVEKGDAGDVVVRVRDTGIGIAADVLPHVFELFVQEGRSRERASGGLGLGLALASHLAALHGGRIDASSAGVGRGSEFTLRLPALAAAPAEEQAGAGPATPAVDGRRRILLVDDNTDIADSLSELLRELGHDVQVASDGPSALRVVPDYHPEVVLLDLGLPGMDGYEVARRVREREKNGTVLIALTGYGQPEDRRRSKEAGFDHHLLKPVRLPELLGLLDAPARPGAPR